jgi:hypothetical protein
MELEGTDGFETTSVRIFYLQYDWTSCQSTGQHANHQAIKEVHHGLAG